MECLGRSHPSFLRTENVCRLLDHSEIEEEPMSFYVSFTCQLELGLKAVDLFDDKTTIAVPNKNNPTILLLHIQVL